MDREYIINLSFTVYKVTELFPKEEPLKTEIRTRVNDILNDLLVFQNNQESGIKTNPPREEIIENIEDLKKYFELAILRKLTSPINFLVLQKEYDKISKAVKKELEEIPQPYEVGLHKVEREEISSRQKELLDIIKERKRVQAGEVQNFFPKISKRTIQRDLAFLVEQGLIQREGEFSEQFYYYPGYDKGMTGV